MSSDRRQYLLSCHRPRPAISALLLLFSLAGTLACDPPGLSGTEPAVDGPPPNILLLVVDTLRADHLGAYDTRVDYTPNLDALAQQSLVFTDALAQGPNTINSSASMLTSTWVSEHGYSNYKKAISERHVTIAEALGQLGYQTFAISTNPHVAERNGLAQGFDTFLDTLTWDQTDAELVNKAFIGWLDERQRNPPAAPFFAMLWYVDPHVPYKPPQEKIDQVVPASLRNLVGERTWRPGFATLSEEEMEVSRLLYRGEVSYFDDQLADLVAKLKERGLYDDALIVLTSDHGESFWEHKGVDGLPVVGHGISLFREETWVPLVLKLPGSARRGVVGSRVSSIDLAPTLLTMARADPDSRIFDRFRGHRLLPSPTDGAGSSRPRVSELYTDFRGKPEVHMESIETDVGKLVRTYVFRRKTYDPPVEWLLDATDRPLVSSPQGVRDARDQLRRALEQWHAGLRPLPPHPVVPGPQDEQLRKRLEALGYL